MIKYFSGIAVLCCTLIIACHKSAPPSGARRVEWQPVTPAGSLHNYEYRHDDVAGDFPVVYWFHLDEDAQGQFFFSVHSKSGDVTLSLQKGMTGKSEPVGCEKSNNAVSDCTLGRNNLTTGDYLIAVRAPQADRPYRLFAGARLRRRL